MRLAGLVFLFLGAVALAPAPAPAQKASGNADAGRRFAEIWCSGCHAVELRTTRSNAIARDFPTIVIQRSTTSRSLRAYLGRRHEKMPNFVLDKEDTDDVVAYLMSLKGK